MVENPGMETHIHPFQVRSVIKNKNLDLYLHTSPEFFMKKLLSEGFEKIFNISYCFRDEPNSPIHRSQFLMLEWYRVHVHYNQIMEDCENVIRFCVQELKTKNIPLRKNIESMKFTKKTIQELFFEILNINILDYLEHDTLLKLIQNQFTDVPLPKNTKDLSWDDLYFLLFLNKVEPHLTQYPYLLLYEFPCHLSALSTIKKDNPKVCERFEIYLNGIELCNCFNELRDISIQKKRFSEQVQDKKKLYNYELPEPQVLYQSLEKGFPPSAGIALGIERLLLGLVDIENPFFI